VLGAWNLHQATLDRDLDAFVLYSSVAATLGSPGQGNYMAGNAFLDALAHHRRGLGLPALSINWGAFSGAGRAAAQANRGERLAARGLAGMTPSEGERFLGELLELDTAQVTVARLDARQWIEFHPQIAGSSWLSELLRVSAVAAKAAGGLRESLAAADPAARAELAVAFVRRQAAQVLRLDPERIDVHAPLKSLGVDSLMGLELRNRLEAALSLTLPATLIWSHPNVAALTANLLDRLGFGDAPAKATPPRPASAAGDHAEPRSRPLEDAGAHANALVDPASPAASVALFAASGSGAEAADALDALSDEELMARLADKLDFPT
jgi:myxalamid-type polyketide synthase MxaB/epothilone polyketide synthase D